MHDWQGYMRMLAMHPASLNTVYDSLPDEALGQCVPRPRPSRC